MPIWKSIKAGSMLAAQGAHAPGLLDPYVVWAHATAFRDYTSAFPLRLLIELDSTEDAAGFQTSCGTNAHIPQAYQTAKSRFCTATVGPGFLKQLSSGQLNSAVLRVDLVEPIIPDRAIQKAPTASAVAPKQRVGSDGPLLLGVIDYGCPFAHRSFRKPLPNGSWGTRVVGLWDQDLGSTLCDDQQQAAPVPAELGYGRELSRAQLDEVMKKHSVGRVIDEDACYDDCGNTNMRRRMSHGAHVMDIMAGPVPVESRLFRQEGGALDNLPDGSAASTADIAFVQLPERCLQDTSGGWLGGQLLDGLRYILACAGPATRRVVVNISYGSYVGPHDGSSVFEQALDALVAETQEQKNITLTIVIPGGNSRLARCHAAERVPAAKTRELCWRVLPDTQTPGFLQLWFDRANDVVVNVTAPDGKTQRFVQGDAATWASSAKEPLAMVIFSTRRGVEKKGGMVLLAVGRTASVDPRYPVAPAGVWTIDIENIAVTGNPVKVHAYVSRNDTDVGMLRRGRQSFLVDPDYDPKRYLRAAVQDPSGRLVGVLRSGTLNGIATGEKVFVVGGWRYRDDKDGRTASEGPTRTNKRKPLTVGMDWVGVSEESAARPGVLAAANRSGTVVRLRGTSFAAPQVARKLAR
ncbi:MAG: hypothetical protein KF892_15685 [Rhizobacter sp.]|nr:hypothetical protein [Rhizobacter sp.]